MTKKNCSESRFQPIFTDMLLMWPISYPIQLCFIRIHNRQQMQQTTKSIDISLCCYTPENEHWANNLRCIKWKIIEFPFVSLSQHAQDVHNTRISDVMINNKFSLNFFFAVICALILLGYRKRQTGMRKWNWDGKKFLFHRTVAIIST